MDVLRSQKDTVDAFIRDHEAVLAPARKILPEILSDIFLWCFCDHMLMSVRDVPIILNKFKSYWRSCAISTPKLWASLRLCTYRNNAQSRAWLVNTALSRSGACPCLREPRLTTIDDDASWDAIVNHSRRWKSLCFQLTSGGLPKLSAIKNALPLLETLDIWDKSGSHTVLDAFEAAPRLRTLFTELSPNVLKVPVEQLKNLVWLWAMCGNMCLGLASSMFQFD